ncbi:hypothetical protein [Desulfomicrobium baculatum]|uniref:Uncharacterized protein n=1 Tax=Desulfomicrobium baculatum (strain DSM 4028 / VKM B-1378 / X) TaxID=525897 RepID=C7LNI5_DESBD|nr:hypothetical protein [Desulfomicrobium baculatum]ACU88870.1 hypothetical protein Dbac_0749 [Desulfomicrobium baculatum DSM 4028]
MCGVIYSKVIDDINREKIASNERNFDKTWNKIKRAPEKALSTFWIWAGLMAVVAIISGINIQRNVATVDHVRPAFPTTSTPSTPKSNISNFHTKYEMRTKEAGECSFKVISNDAPNTVFILLDQASRKMKVIIYVKKGDDIELKVPPGDYMFQMIQGETWLSEKEHFGLGTTYLDGQKIISFEKTERGTSGNIVKLKAIDGNLKTVRTARINLQ